MKWAAETKIEKLQHEKLQAKKIEKLEELQKYIQFSGDVGNECFSCESSCTENNNCHQECKYVLDEVNKCVTRHIESRLPNYLIESRECGQDGIAYIVEHGNTKRVLKVIICSSIYFHTQRFQNWKYAESRKIGPVIISGEYCPFYVGEIDLGISIICMHYWGVCRENESEDAKKILNLIDLAHESGILHTDPKNDNIRCGPRNAIFIDWEDIMILRKNKEIIKYLMLCKLVVDSKNHVSNVYKEVLKNLGENVRTNAIEFVRDLLPAGDVKKTYEDALGESEAVLNNMTVSEFYKTLETKRKPLSELNLNF